VAGERNVAARSFSFLSAVLYAEVAQWCMQVDGFGGGGGGEERSGQNSPRRVKRQRGELEEGGGRSRGGSKNSGGVARAGRCHPMLLMSD